MQTNKQIGDVVLSARAAYEALAEEREASGG